VLTALSILVLMLLAVLERVVVLLDTMPSRQRP
jgi:hypothetical protein